MGGVLPVRRNLGAGLGVLPSLPHLHRPRRRRRRGGRRTEPSRIRGGRIMTGDADYLAIAICSAVISLTLWVTFAASRRAKSADGFFAAGRSISSWQNGFAIAGEFISAGSFLGTTGLIFSKGVDGTVILFTSVISFLPVLFLLAEKMRNLGKYTLADVLVFRTDSRNVRVAVALSTIATGTFVLLAQLVAAGVLLESVSGIPFWLSVVVAGSLMGIYVFVGGHARHHLGAGHQVDDPVGARDHRVLRHPGAVRVRIPEGPRRRNRQRRRGRRDPVPRPDLRPDQRDQPRLLRARVRPGHRRNGAHPHPVLHRPRGHDGTSLARLDRRAVQPVLSDRHRDGLRRRGRARTERHRSRRARRQPCGTRPRHRTRWRSRHGRWVHRARTRRRGRLRVHRRSGRRCRDLRGRHLRPRRVAGGHAEGTDRESRRGRAGPGGPGPGPHRPVRGRVLQRPRHRPGHAHRRRHQHHLLHGYGVHGGRQCASARSRAEPELAALQRHRRGLGCAHRSRLDGREPDVHRGPVDGQRPRSPDHPAPGDRHHAARHCRVRDRIDRRREASGTRPPRGREVRGDAGARGDRHRRGGRRHALIRQRYFGFATFSRFAANPLITSATCGSSR
ncbi:SSF family Na(+)/solute symporter [Rhodococcus pyridinivorans AK37]|uniref:SSF family Na(+)/solute symporter n=1 Tax=Rhodococcus pyridinivorans AK37 TaxID=1114960 RepID=H0JU41_9NOCA|nr:SSF family Na(+)/solute symporter [Rhodococcus pyridinivorans AK37]